MPTLNNIVVIHPMELVFALQKNLTIIRVVLFNALYDLV